MDSKFVSKQDLHDARFYLRKCNDTLASGKQLNELDKRNMEWSKKTLKKWEESNNASDGSGSSKRNRSLDESHAREHKKGRTESAATQRKDYSRPSTSSGSRYERSSNYKSKDKEPSASSRQHKELGNPQKKVQKSGEIKLSMSDVLKQDLKVVVVDNSEADLRISQENFKKIDKAIFEAVYKFAVENPGKRGPSFTQNERYRGFTVVNCDCHNSVEFLKNTLKNLAEPWRGAKLSVLLPKAYVMAPVFDNADEVDRAFGEMSLIVIKSQNSDIPTSKWKLLRVGKKIGSRVLLTIAIDQDSYEALEKRNFKISLGLSEIQVRATKGGLIAEEEKEIEQTTTAIETMMETDQLEEGSSPAEEETL